MLCKNAVAPATLELLKKISGIKEFDSFALGGGTNLALRMGHRVSIDLYFLTNNNFNTASVFQIITKRFPSGKLLFEQDQTMIFSINDIRVDFVSYPFPWLHSFDNIDEARLLNIEDIIPMKLQAVSNRNAKKDYWDIAALLKDYTLAEMIKIFSLKFSQIDTGFIIHSLTDFEKADTEPDPDTINEDTNWDEIKTKLTNTVETYTNSLLQ